MTPEELMRPRYKVIADYPKSRWPIGEILDRDWGWDGDDEVGFKHHLSHYPHLFKRLEWWEERKIDEMPEYIKEGDRIWKLKHWDKDMLGYPTPVNHVDVEGETDHFAAIAWHFKKDKILPATREEYEQYKQKEEAK